MDIDVQSTFSDMVECGSVSNQHQYNLTAFYKENPKVFISQLEGCYLKIVKHFTGLNKSQRRLFEVCTEKFFSYILKEDRKNPEHAQKEGIKQLIRHFLKFFCEGLESSQFMIRICCGRHLFMLLKGIQPMNDLIDEKLAFDLLNNTVGLFRSGRAVKNSKTERGLAVKLGAYLQHIQPTQKESKLKQISQALKGEMIRTVCEEERKDLRLDALTNLELNESSLQYVLMRIRDTDVNIRLQVLKKLMKSRMSFSSFNVAEVYQLIYDGIRNSSVDVRKQCQTLLVVQFYMIREQIENDLKENLPISMQEEEEEPKKKVSQVRKRLSLSTSQNSQELQLIKLTIQRFLAIFQIEKTLMQLLSLNYFLSHPNMYDVVVEVVKTIVTQYRQPSEIALYLKDLFTSRMVNYGKVSGDELFFIRVVGLILASELDSSILTTIDTHFLDGCQLADFLRQLNKENTTLLELHETIQLTATLINCDQTGRAELQSVIKELILVPVKIKQIQRTVLQDQFNEVYENLTEAQIESKWFAQHHFETGIVRDYFSLIQSMVKVLKKLFLDDPYGLTNFIYGIIMQIRAPVVGQCEDVDEGNLMQQKRGLELKLKIQDEQKSEQLLKLKELRQQKKKTNQQQTTLLETSHNETIQYIQLLQQQLMQVDEQIAFIDTHALYIIDAFFGQVDINLANEPPILRLREMLLTLNKIYHESGCVHRLPKKLGLKCLAYVPLFGKDTCLQMLPIFTNILDASLGVTQQEILLGDDPTIIVALRCVLDCMLLYDFDDNVQFGVGGNIQDKITITNLLVNIALKSKGTLQCTALEGVAKLLLHQKVPCPQIYVAILLFLWFDKGIKEQHLPLQVVTTFFKCFITSSLELLQTFEKGLEVYACICCFLNSRANLKLNQSYLQGGHWQEQQIQRNIMVGIKMLHFKTISGHTSYAELKDKLQRSPQDKLEYLLGPQEMFLIFLCKMVGEFNSLILRNLMNEREYDFPQFYDTNNEREDNIQVEKGLFEILISFLKVTVDELEQNGRNSSVESNFMKSMMNIIGGTECTFQSDAVRVINDEFDTQKSNVNYVVKMFKENGIILDDPKGTRDRDLMDVQIRQQPTSNPQTDDEDQQSGSLEISLQNQKRTSKTQKQGIESDSELHQKQLSQKDSIQISDDEIESIPTKGRKKAIQKRKRGGKKV